MITNCYRSPEGVGEKGRTSLKIALFSRKKKEGGMLWAVGRSGWRKRELAAGSGGEQTAIVPRLTHWRQLAAWILMQPAHLILAITCSDNGTNQTTLMLQCTALLSVPPQNSLQWFHPNRSLYNIGKVYIYNSLHLNQISLDNWLTV